MFGESADDDHPIKATRYSAQWRGVGNMVYTVSCFAVNSEKHPLTDAVQKSNENYCKRLVTTMNVK